MLFGLNNSCQDCSTVPSKPIQNRKINGPLSCTQVSVLITEAERPGLLKFKLSKYKSGAFLKQCHSSSCDRRRKIVVYMDSAFSQLYIGTFFDMF